MSTSSDYTRRHLFNIGSLSKDEVEIIRKVNNPNVIQTIQNTKLDRVSNETMEKYTKKIVDYWTLKLKNINENQNINTREIVD